MLRRVPAIGVGWPLYSVVGQAGAEILALGVLWGLSVLLEQDNPLRKFEGSLLGSVREFPLVGDIGPCWRDEPRRAGSAGGFCRPRPIGARISAVWPLWEPLRCRGGFPLPRLRGPSPGLCRRLSRRVLPPAWSRGRSPLLWNVPLPSFSAMRCRHDAPVLLHERVGAESCGR